MEKTHVQKYLPHLLEPVGNGDLHPEAIISHRLPLEDTACGYEMFDEKQDGCRKVVLGPGLAS